MIRVLHYIGSMEHGGSQAMIMNLYRNIDRTEIQFDFVVHSYGITELAEEAQSLGAIIYHCPPFRMTTIINYCSWWSNFLRNHPEYRIVHSHVRSTAAIVLYIAKKHNCVTISHSHSTSSGNGFSAIVKNCIQFPIRYVADYFMGCSQEAGEWLFGKRICASNRYFNVHNAIDATKYIFDSATSTQIRLEFGYTSDDFVIGHVGRFVEPKNHRFLIDVFNLVYEKDQRYRLLLVGEGELQEDIREQIKSYSIEDCVKMAGARTDVNKLMMAMDLFLFPSRWEGLGIALIEAQATGCPCIASASIPAEARVCELVNFVSLNKPIEYWSNCVLAAPKISRENMYKVISGHGYDVTETVQWIQKFYNNCTQ